MKSLFDSIPSFLFPIILFVLVCSLILLTIGVNGTNNTTDVTVPKPPELYSSSFCQIGTGNKLGTYYPVGQILAEWLNENISQNEKPFKCTETNGSVDNINLLKNKNFSFAMIESRIALESFNGKNAKNKFEDLRLVWPLWPDVVQIICASGSNIVNISDMAGKHGFLGQKNSSTFRTSTEILKSFSLSPMQIISDIQPGQVLKALSRNKIQFATIQAGIPNLTVADAVIFNSCKLVSFSEQDIERLKKCVSTSCESEIPAGYYTSSQTKIRTLGIPNALWSRKDVSSQTVELLVSLMVKGLPRLSLQHKAVSDVPSNPEQAMEIMKKSGVPIHKGTLNYLNKVLKRK